jgi:alpha-glucuronidase
MRRRHFGLLRTIIILMLSFPPVLVSAEDGYELWLRYRPLPQEVRERVAGHLKTIMSPGPASPSVRAAMAELQNGLSSLLDHPVSISTDIVSGAVILGTPASLPWLHSLGLPLAELGREGYLVKDVVADGQRVILIAANSDIGLVYGAFELLRRVQSNEPIAGIEILEAPKVQLRLLNHWDNLDRTVERGYAGQSIWDWWRLPDIIDPRYTDYARANASVGINGVVLNNVNARPEVLTDRYIAKAAALADVFRPWGIRVFLSVRFSSPVDIGGLTTADPLDPAVREWWETRAGEIYSVIPDFGGFLVKANSEGQPGPQNYGRTHADGANMLAAALQPHNGVVMWRAFVYSDEDPEDRVKQAFNEFTPLDGTFADNVLVQVKNGPLDFQPREPFHPLFGSMPQTPLMMEFQITKEYLGFSTHLVYLGTLWEEVLDAETHVQDGDSTVANIINGTLHRYPLTGMAGVANIGADRDWSGSPFDQANWYAFGRLAWNPHRSSKTIAGEWLRQTFSTAPEFVGPATDIMMRSREAAVDYMTPLGLTHIMGTGHHYGPAPWVSELGRPEWNPYYYHRADNDAIGFDRTPSGSNAVAQYAPELASLFANPATTPDTYLLWFHRLPWDYRMRSGQSLWQELIEHYDHGVAEVERMQADWAQLEPWVDAQRFERVGRLLAIQLREARWWRDACIAYFARQSGLELPPGVRPPEHDLEYYQSLEFPYAPGN